MIHSVESTANIMKPVTRKILAFSVLLTAATAHADFLTYSNSIVVPGGNPPTVMAFTIPQFNPSDGTLDSVTLTMYSSFQFLFTYDGSSASGVLTFTQTNSLSFLYNGSDELSQFNFGAFKFTADLPSRGQAFTPATAPTLRGQSIFSDAVDLANFAGMGEIPLSADYYNQPTVTWTSGAVTWSQDASATMAAVVTYDFTPIPEPSTIGFLFVGGLLFALRNRITNRGHFVEPPKEV